MNGYLHPNDVVQIQLGTLRFKTDQKGPGVTTVFELSSRNRFGFRLNGLQFVLVFMNVSDASGKEVLACDDNHFKHEPRGVYEVEQRQGRVKVTAPATSNHLADWVAKECCVPDREIKIENGRFTLADIDVPEAGVVRVQGVWAEEGRAIVADHRQLAVSVGKPHGGSSFFRLAGYTNTFGDGGIATVNVQGPLTESVIRTLLKQQGF